MPTIVAVFRNIGVYRPQKMAKNERRNCPFGKRKVDRENYSLPIGLMAEKNSKDLLKEGGLTASHKIW